MFACLLGADLGWELLGPRGNSRSNPLRNCFLKWPPEVPKTHAIMGSQSQPTEGNSGETPALLSLCETPQPTVEAEVRVCLRRGKSMREAVTRSVSAASLALSLPGERASTWPGRQGLAQRTGPDEEALCAQCSWTGCRLARSPTVPSARQSGLCSWSKRQGQSFTAAQTGLLRAPAEKPAEGEARRNPESDQTGRCQRDWSWGACRL